MNRLIGISDLAAILNVDERHIYRLEAERRIPYISGGHLPRFDADEVQRWLDDNRVEPLPQLDDDATPDGCIVPLSGERRSSWYRHRRRSQAEV